MHFQIGSANLWLMVLETKGLSELKDELVCSFKLAAQIWG